MVQILFLGVLLGAGALVRDFTLRPEQMALTFAAGLATQLACVRALGLQRVGVLSALITCLGLSILLRADSLWVHPLAAALAIASKFSIRAGGKHLFNPGNLGVIAGVALIPGAWISPGQWGSDVAYAAWFLALGAVVSSRAQRLDTSWAFLACYLGLVAARVAWLGYEWAVFVHQLESGALLLFAFFMISDPMTTPNHRGARVAHAAVVAAGAFAWQFLLFLPNGLVWALFIATPLVPLLDRVFRAERFNWRDNRALPTPGSPAPRTTTTLG
ncbi:MAG: RnfABCDGE type electron transport complex subunit D [Betaproteobacteria bacterium]|jgi:Na+-transporting NADH:ubiquinone oxidoreductase subunit NqrB|nr:RnfABCDGE type electron transport complex subunit D [Betaproteobacteria bacterium]